jgi:hypothetical protein
MSPCHMRLCQALVCRFSWHLRPVKMLARVFRTTFAQSSIVGSALMAIFRESLLRKTAGYAIHVTLFYSSSFSSTSSLAMLFASKVSPSFATLRNLKTRAA